ncbi:MAG: DUF4363 family protein [Clostridiales bacterium]|nr:DUF4363 family protein [Clostridiales bacterium]
MRDLIISLICLILILVPWGIYEGFSEKTIHQYKTILSKEVIPSIEKDDWKTAMDRFDFIAKDWDKYKKTSAFFIDTESINETDGIVSKTYYYIKLKDPSNSAGEAAYLKYSFDFLHKNEKPSIANVF